MHASIPTIQGASFAANAISVSRLAGRRKSATPDASKPMRLQTLEQAVEEVGGYGNRFMILFLHQGAGTESYEARTNGRGRFSVMSTSRLVFDKITRCG